MQQAQVEQIPTYSVLSLVSPFFLPRGARSRANQGARCDTETLAVLSEPS